MGSQQSVPNTPEDTPRSLLSVPSFKKAAPPLPPPTHRGNHPLQPTEARRLSTAHAVPRENPRAPCSSMDAHTVTGMCACSQYQSRFLNSNSFTGHARSGRAVGFLGPCVNARRHEGQRTPSSFPAAECSTGRPTESCSTRQSSTFTVLHTARFWPLSSCLTELARHGYASGTLSTGLSFP